MFVVITQVLLGFVLFFLIGWIGRHSYSFGYHKIDFLIDKEDAPAFNFLIRVFLPSVFIIIVSLIFYAFELDKFTKNIYLVSVFYVFLGIFHNLVMGRFLILNIKLQFTYAVLISLSSYYAYIELIKPKKPIIPNLETMSNEIWMIIILFLFHIFNKIELSEVKKYERLCRYVRVQKKRIGASLGESINDSVTHMVEVFKKSLNEDLVKKDIDMEVSETEEYLKALNGILSDIVYAIIIYENFNRPKATRYLENLVAKNTEKPRTLGIMQVTTERLLTDKESIEKGCAHLLKALLALFSGRSTENYYGFAPTEIISRLSSSYNGGEGYSTQIKSIIAYMYNRKDFIDETAYKMHNDIFNDPWYDDGVSGVDNYYKKVFEYNKKLSNIK